jgi:hypothetical protein
LWNGVRKREAVATGESSKRFGLVT